MSYRQRESVFGWATAAVYSVVGKSHSGFTPRLKPTAGFASEGVEPGQSFGARTFNWLLGVLFAMAMRTRVIDLANWTTSGDTTPNAITPWAAVAYDPGSVRPALLIVAGDAEARASVDGHNWVDADTANALGSSPRAALWVGGGAIDLWIVVGASSIFTRPRDFPGASAWTARVNPVASNWNAIAWGPTATEKVVICGSSGKIASSVDGVSYTNRSPAGSDDFRSVCFGAGLYVVVGNAGRIFTSANGQTWTARTSGTTSNLVFVTRDDRAGVFVAIASDGTVRTSPDGVTWSAGTTITGDPVVACAHDGEGSIVVLQDAAEPSGTAFFGLARRSAVRLSTDGGATWDLVGRISGDFIPRSIVWAGDLGWIAAGGDNLNEGTVYRSVRV